jgi:hypothetical protein
VQWAHIISACAHSGEGVLLRTQAGADAPDTGQTLTVTSPTTGFTPCGVIRKDTRPIVRVRLRPPLAERPRANRPWGAPAVPGRRCDFASRGRRRHELSAARFRDGGSAPRHGWCGRGFSCGCGQGKPETRRRTVALGRLDQFPVHRGNVAPPELRGRTSLSVIRSSRCQCTGQCPVGGVQATAPLRWGRWRP